MKQDMSMNESVSPLGKLRPASPRIAPLVDLTEELQTIMGGGINSPAGTPLNIFGTIADDQTTPRAKNHKRYFGVFAVVPQLAHLHRPVS